MDGGAHQCVLTRGVSLGAAANAGVRGLDTEYVVRIDGDDWIASELLEFEANYLDDRPEVDCVWCDTERAHLLSDGIGWQVFSLEPNEERDLLLSCGAMYRRSCWEQLGGYADRDHGENLDYWKRFREAGFVAERLALPLYRYRQHGDNMHNSDEARKAKDEFND